MIVKVCGMKCPKNIRQVGQCGADWMGFICYERSPRFIGTEIPIETPHMKRVGVFVNSDFDHIMDYVRRLSLQMVQLHGSESPQLCERLRAEGLEVIKAFPGNNVSQTDSYAPYCNYFLFDTPCSRHGGSGRTFDWTTLSLYKEETPFLLSGGICPDSLQALAEFYHPQWVGIDLNSGFELSPALKDATALHSFITQFKHLPL